MQYTFNITNQDMANYRPFIKPSYVAKDGTTPLYVRYDYDRTKRTLIKIGFSIKPEHWDDKKKWIKKASPKFEEIDATLTKIISKISNILVFAKENNIDPTVDFILLEIEKNREYEQRSTRINMFSILDQFIIDREGKVLTDQIKDYKTLRKHLTKFKEFSSQPVTFKNLNLKFYEEFMDYLSNKLVQRDGTIGLLTNSAGKVIKLLKAFVNYQIANKVIPPVDLSKFVVVTEETDAIYLNENELEIIYKLDLYENRDFEVVRDVFIVGCYTGLRYSDLSNLNSENIDVASGNIHIKQKKVHRAVTIPMLDYVPIILEKYNYMLPKIPQHKFNIAIKEIGKLANINIKVEIVNKKGNSRITAVYEKWELISSHTCRRSFCTNMFRSGFPAEELMKISGHKSSSAFMRYIKIDGAESADRLRTFRKNRLL